LAARFYGKPAIADPCAYGFCDIINQVVRKRAWARDSFARQEKESDLRTRLIEKRAIIEKAIAGKDKVFVENYVRRVLKNKLTNDQSRGEGRIISNSVSLSDGGTPKNYRQEQADEYTESAGRALTNVVGGDSSSSDDDLSLDRPDTLVAPEPGKKKQSEAKRLFDKMQAEALSQISTLTGGRQDGHDTYMDLEKALSQLPENEQEVFAALFLENGELLADPRTYPDAEILTGYSLQTIRTLERRATQALRPALGPSFFTRKRPT